MFNQGDNFDGFPVSNMDGGFRIEKLTISNRREDFAQWTGHIFCIAFQENWNFHLTPKRQCPTKGDVVAHGCIDNVVLPSTGFLNHENSLKAIHIYIYNALFLSFSSFFRSGQGTNSHLSFLLYFFY